MVNWNKVYFLFSMVHLTYYLMTYVQFQSYTRDNDAEISISDLTIMGKLHKANSQQAWSDYPNKHSITQDILYTWSMNFY